MPRLSAPDHHIRASRQLAGDVSPADFSEALARGLRVLEAFDAASTRLSLADLSRHLDLPRATVRRAVLTLEALGFVESQGRTFAPTPQVLRLASSYLTANAISAVLQPACEELAHQLGVNCSAAVLDGSDAVMIARATPQQLVPIGAGIGFRIPAAPSALGRALLAAQTSDRADEVIDAYTDDRTERRRLKRDMRQVRGKGWAYVANEAEPGYQSVAVPVARWDGTVVAALNIGESSSGRSAGWMTGEGLGQLLRTANGLRQLLV